jgi:HPt (histidine-containing phosphotransfer) domain-containing protein
LPGIDVEAALEFFAGSRELFESALVSFARNRRTEIEQVAALLERDAREPLEKLLHDLAGSAGMLGAGAVYSAVRELEDALRTGTPKDLREGVRRLNRAFEEVADGVNRHFP